MSVPDMCESVIVLCDSIRNRALSITEEHNAQLRHAECGEDAAEHLAQRMHATCEELEADNLQLQQAHDHCFWKSIKHCSLHGGLGNLFTWQSRVSEMRSGLLRDCNLNMKNVKLMHMIEDIITFQL